MIRKSFKIQLNYRLEPINTNIDELKLNNQNVSIYKYILMMVRT